MSINSLELIHLEPAKTKFRNTQKHIEKKLKTNKQQQTNILKSKNE